MLLLRGCIRCLVNCASIAIVAIIVAVFIVGTSAYVVVFVIFVAYKYLHDNCE